MQRSRRAGSVSCRRWGRTVTGWNDGEIMETPVAPHANQWRSFLKSCGNVAAASQPFQLSGSLTRVTGLVMEAVGLKLAVGSGCTVLLPNGNSVEAEVVGFHGERLYLMP